MDTDWSQPLSFTSENVLRHIPVTAGVYVLGYVESEWPDELRSFYIGAASNMLEEMRRWLFDREANLWISIHVDAYPTFFSYLVVEDEALRHGIATFLHQHAVDTVCADAAVGSVPVESALPDGWLWRGESRLHA